MIEKKSNETAKSEMIKKSYSEPKLIEVANIKELTKGTQQDGADAGTGGNFGPPISQG